MVLVFPPRENSRFPDPFPCPISSADMNKAYHLEYALFNLAGAEGIEPPTAVLETAVIPLN